MKKMFRASAAVLSAVIALGSIQFSAFAQTEEENFGTVVFSVENNTFFGNDEVKEPAFTGQLLNTVVALKEDSDVFTVMLDALKEGNISQTGVESGWITEVGGLKASDAGAMGSWMYTLNDWFTDDIGTAYNVKNGTLADGDEIVLCYTTNWGADLDYDWQGTDTSLKVLEPVSGGILFQAGTDKAEFDPACKEYELNATENTVSFDITALNRAFKVTVDVDGKVYNKKADLPVSSGSVITITCGSGDSASVYKINVSGGEALGYVDVKIENNTYKGTEGNAAPFEGVLAEGQVPIYKDSNLFTAFAEFCKKNKISVTGLEAGWITEVGGLSSEAGGGWMYTLNDWVTDDIGSAYSVEKGTLSEGDQICFTYTMDWGADIGYDWQGTDTSLKDLVVKGATLVPEFKSDVFEYEVKYEGDDAVIFFNPVAVNKAFNVTMMLDDKPIKRTYGVSTADDIHRLVITCGKGEDASVYYVKFNDKPEDGEDPAPVPTVPDQYYLPDDGQEDMEAFRLDPTNEYYKVAHDIYKHFGEHIDEDYNRTLEALIKSSKEELSEWVILALARAGKLDKAVADRYYNAVCEKTKEIEGNKINPDMATDNAKVALVLKAIGYDPSDVNGKDFLAPLCDIEYASAQGLNGVIFSLIAIDAAGYKTPARDEMVKFILDKQVDGGFTFMGDKADIDMTAMTLTALAPYAKNDDVKPAVDKALARLSELVSDALVSGEGTSESYAQTLLALTALGIDPLTDERFVYDGVTVIDAVALHSTETGFSHKVGGYRNAISTEQAFYALVSYYRVKDGKTSLFDMNTIDKSDDGETNPPTGGRIPESIAVISFAALAVAVISKKRK